MSKKPNKSDVGRSLIKSRFSRHYRKYADRDNFLHTAELQDGCDWNRLNLRSVTEQDSFTEFLSTAELAGTEFAAEKLNVAFVSARSTVGLLSKDEITKATNLHNEHKNILKIPRRPDWRSMNSADELQLKERETFLEWRRNLTIFQEQTGLIVTPYEKNLDFWRQLWRVVERSDVLVQIVDSRNPLLFRSEDLEDYVHETDKNWKKSNILLCNKADFLTNKQRSIWARYFTSIGIRAVFFSAITNSEDDINQINNEQEFDSCLDDTHSQSDDDDYETADEEEIIGLEVENSVITERVINSAKLLTREQLIELFRSYKNMSVKESVTIGLVGYPNVGKSSIINSLLTYKKVSVSATPGKTKHFQTVYLDKDVMLCDCPGLVMPSFVLTKADMMLNGILPIDQMRDHVPAVNLLCTLIPRHVLEHTYGIMIPKPDDGEDPNRPPFSEELLNSYAYNHGFMTANGQPDNSRAARYILKDFVNGKLLYCYSPPVGCVQNEFHTFSNIPEKRLVAPTAKALRAIKLNKTSASDVDNKFFADCNKSNIHTKGIIYRNGPILQLNSKNPAESKPWKNHKEKRNKHVKLRIQYRYLDE